MIRQNESEKRERERRSQYLSGVHGNLPKRKARAVVAAEQGYSHSGIAKLADVRVSEATVSKWLQSVVEEFGVEAVFGKYPDERKGPLGPSTQINSHMPYEPDAMEQQAEQADEHTFSGEISEIEESTTGEVYGDEARNSDREVIIVSVTVETTTDTMEFSDTFSLPAGPQSWHNPNYKLGKFHEKYGELPRADMEVEVGYNDDGYLRINVE